ncbi:hypothetical protein Mgra_00010137 [Meloidogyne graminicola]|uniref:Transmembrane protein n=1 Tax=Meloidogyne graminicola TaxID=189291 RepID=A0A8S9ZD22_9BILA|nr:hypothetical protein Mgra_00010137 [Meloidogyne graminicola]
MSKITTKIFLKIITFLLFLLATTLNSSNAGSVRRHNRHHQQQKKDYSSGVFVDRVPISTDSSSSSSNYSKTNRFTSKYPTKLRKFREDIGHKNNDDDIVERRRWLEELFVQKKRKDKFGDLLFLSSIFNKIVEIKIIFVLYYPFRRENVPLVVEDVHPKGQGYAKPFGKNF